MNHTIVSDTEIIVVCKIAEEKCYTQKERENDGGEYKVVFTLTWQITGVNARTLTN